MLEKIQEAKDNARNAKKKDSEQQGSGTTNREILAELPDHR
jgi:hypothetical protein